MARVCWMFRRVAPGVVAVLALGPVQPVRAQTDTAWVHARVRTEGGPGEQVTHFQAIATADQAGTVPVVVSQLCIKGVAHRTQERCEDNVASVELVERTTGLPGVGALCVEAYASALWKTVPLSATARACP